MSPSAIETIRRALAEDIGSGDITSEAFIPEGHRSHARIIAKEDLVLSGTEAAVEVFRIVDPAITVALHASDGTEIAPGNVVLTAGGPTRSLLAAERTALNFLQQLSGIATLTRAFVDAVLGTKAVILDTRKTTPGLREFERAAVVAGGGVNHRCGLFDRILAKDNHLAVTGDAEGLQAAIDHSQASVTGTVRLSTGPKRANPAWPWKSRRTPSSRCARSAPCAASTSSSSTTCRTTNFARPSASAARRKFSSKPAVA